MISKKFEIGSDNNIYSYLSLNMNVLSTPGIKDIHIYIFILSHKFIQQNVYSFSINSSDY